MTRIPTPSLRSGLLALAALALMGCASSGTAGNDVFEKGLREAEAGRVEAAIKTLSDGVKSHPGHWRMRFELGRLQYESGEAFHLDERRALRQSEEFLLQGEREKARANRRRASDLRAKATPYYQAARENLRIVVTEVEDEHKVAWASYILMRVDIFFEDWERAQEDIRRAIELGKPTGPQLRQFREYEAGIRDKLRRRVGY